MSHSFYVEDVPGTSLAETLAALPIENVMADCDVPERGWPDIAHVYQDGVSVRAVETALEGGRLQVRIMAASSPDGFALAAAIVEAVATRHGVPVESDAEDVFGPSLMRVRPEGSDKEVLLAVLGPGVVTALSTRASYVVLTAGFEDTERWSLNVPFDDFAAAAGDTLTWLDDAT